jgi:hypothetical protein
MSFPSQPMVGRGSAAVILATEGGTNRRTAVQASLGIKQDPILKITEAKGVGVVA